MNGGPSIPRTATGPAGAAFPLMRTPPARALSRLYGAGVSLRNAAFDSIPFLSHSAGRPVISIGGVHAGGTGKTPCAILTARILLELGYRVAVLSRGYKRESRALLIVNPGDRISWRDAGDEPAQIHANLPQTWMAIGPDRHSGAQRLHSVLPDKSVFLLDDGFQHRRLKRDMDIVCLPADPFSDRLLPAGFLREPIESIRRAQVILLVGNTEESGILEKSKARIAEMVGDDIAIMVVQAKPGAWIDLATGQSHDSPPFERPTALCGIARPERFEATLRTLGVQPAAFRVFSDHHRFRPEEIAHCLAPGSDGIVTTEKDAMRIRDINLVIGLAICYLKINLGFAHDADKEDFVRIAQSRIGI
jgi:tetraacyldisaccharide 4'-kinase